MLPTKFRIMRVIGRDQAALTATSPTYLFNWTDIQKIDHAVLHIANGQNKVLFDF